MSEANLEKDFNAVGDVFKCLYSNMKSSFPIWEDFIQRGQRFQRSLEQLIVAFNAFLDGFARLADVAGHSKGGSQDMGTDLTNLVRWHKAVELKIREINYSLSTKLLTPVGNRLDEWKKSLSGLEKDHEKEMSRSIKETKEIVKVTVKANKTLESKRKKDKNIGPLLQQYEQMQTETDKKVADTELKEKVHMSRLMVEERVWFATLSNALMSVLDNELTLTSDLERLPELISSLKDSSNSPSILPETYRDYIENWQIPIISGSRSRLNSQMSTLSHHSESNPSLEVPTEMSISGPMNTHGSTMMTPVEQPSLGPPPPPPSHPPPPSSELPSRAPLFSLVQPSQSTGQSHPSTQSGMPRPPLPEEMYDVPVTSAYVSVSPSQVSLVSNSSHHSADSTHSSTRSASPPYAHQYHGHHYPSMESHVQPPRHLSTGHYQQPSSLTTQQEVMNRSRAFVDIERPNQFNKPQVEPESSRYIPATLPRPRRGSNPPGTQPKPTRPSGSRQFPTQTPTQPAPFTVDEDNDDTNETSAFAQALRQQRLRKAQSVSDRSAPKVH